MKVLYIIDSLEGYGAEKSIVQLALNFKEITPVFFHLFKGDKLKGKLEKEGITVYSLNLSSKTSEIKNALKLLIPIIQSEKPVIIHSTLFRADIVARKLKVIFPHIFLVGSLVSNSYGVNRYKQLSILSKFKLISTQIKDRLTSGKVDYFICNSNAIKKTNIRALGIPSEKVKVIYRGRSFKDYNSIDGPSGLLRQEFGLKDQIVFLNVSRLHKGKGQADLLIAFSELRKVVPNIVLLIAGEGPFREELEIIIKNLNLESNVYLLGYREDVSELLNNSDFFVFPTYFEGLPGALIEAIICRTPSIVSAIEENKECFNGANALFFETGNIDDLKAKMEQALNLENWNQMTQDALLNAQSNFDISKVSLEYEEFYKSILLHSKDKN